MSREKRNTAKQTQPGRLRIVAGKWRSRLLPIADQAGLRPTSERIRETLFNWLAPQIVGSRCLDLFSGSGALGFESISRDAKLAVLVEKSPSVAESLRQSSKLLEADNVEVICADALQLLASPPLEPYDIVYLDPPFADDLVAQCCTLLHRNSWLADGAAVYIEQDKKRSPPDLPHGWQVEKEKLAGNVRYMLVRVASQAQ